MLCGLILPGAYGRRKTTVYSGQGADIVMQSSEIILYMSGYPTQLGVTNRYKSQLPRDVAGRYFLVFHLRRFQGRMPLAD
jgi:hypothetical protein